MTIAVGTFGDDVGRGRLGLRSGMRDFVDLMSESTGLREALVELRPGKMLTPGSWSVHSGATHKQSLSQTFDGVVLDVVAVRTLVDPALVRAETAALCVSTAGTYYYDPDAGSPELYVHLSDGSDPGDTEVSAAFALYLSERAVIHPALGPEKLTDGGFEAWTGKGNATHWTEVTGSGATVEWVDSAIRGYGSQKSAHLTVTSTASASPGEKITNGAVVSGALYRLAGSYMTSGAVANVRVGIGTNYITSDGRETTTGTGGLDLADTGGEWRRFVLDFRAWADSSAVEVLVQARAVVAGITTGEVWFDSLTWRRIYRYVLWEPRMVDGAAPSVDVGKSDVWFGPARVGSGDFAIANADGWADDALSGLNILGAEVRVSVAGAFGDGQDVLIDDARQAMVGAVQDVEADDAQVSLSVEDVRATIHVELPKRSFPVATGCNRPGKKRPLLFGTKTNITPTRMGVNANGYGLYEIADCADWPTGIKNITAVYAYADEAAAAAKLGTGRVSLVAGTHYSADLANGQFQVTKDLGPYRVGPGTENTHLNIDIGGGEVTGLLTAGLRAAVDLASHVASVLTAAAGATVSCTYSESTHKFTISKAAGTLSLLTGTGSNVAFGAWGLLGFTSGSDYTGSLSYTSDEATFDASDDTHDGFILRVDAEGYKDDTSGTYTGSADALIERAADIARFIWRRFMLQDSALIDSASFAAARAGATADLGIYIEDSISSQDVFSVLEQTALGDITIDGSGGLFFDLYPSSTDLDAPTVADDEIFAYAESRSRADVFARVQVFYDRDPTTRVAAASIVETDSVKVRHGRIDAQDFETYLTLDTDADALAADLATLAAAAPVVVRITAGPILFDRRVSQRVYLTRARAPMQSGGSLSAIAHRIRSMKKRFQDGLVDVVLIPFVTL